MLQIWGRRTSSNVQALMWCVGELGLEYERHDAGHIYGMTDTKQFYEMNPNRTVPVLRDENGPFLWETGAVLRYLSATYGDNAFWPEDVAKKALIDMWAEWAKINIAMSFTGSVFWRVVRTPEDQRDPAAIEKALAAFHTKLKIAEDRLQDNFWLCGRDFTLADIQFGHVLFRYFDIDIERPDWPMLRAYFDRLMKRSAYCEHVAISYEELRGSPPN